jgi:hypothetical protein
MKRYALNALNILKRSQLNYLISKQKLNENEIFL